MSTTQLNLIPNLPPSISQAEREFLEFHTKNPYVYSELAKLARKAKALGRTRCGMKHLWEALRWEYSFAKNGRQFKAPNAFTPYYARLIMQQEPDLKGFFTTRVK